MFKKFTKADVHTKSNIKSSVQRGLKSKLVSTYPRLQAVIDDLVPKKSQLIQTKCEDNIILYSINSQVVFYEYFNELIPSLKVVHKYPELFSTVQVDRGAIKFVLSGANIMCPGLTSKGANLPSRESNLLRDSIVVVNAEGKENALAIGKLAMSTEEIKSINKGIGIEVLHYLGDGLWKLHLD
ncbi:translation machinery-associated protein 20 ASCRUDRAFT_107246 [Ascoidea rubescens DSM 1968]|uniref:Translation machinery-associated protein 20 n=1 Tax=Ascoidea rubescens DSM 1968 TaxID=1344418 RepID=A0A1D2VDW9_9ASCO|nr:hypothetical protein ASCRUDRAFT_107246 [Ascoidea rubescens DSM 1968]ODV59825.1 hypothetical protein ASCRUDRAFT_107246 [Ascoidea rubescens DSM 1968]